MVQGMWSMGVEAGKLRSWVVEMQDRCPEMLPTLFLLRTSGWRLGS